MSAKTFKIKHKILSSLLIGFLLLLIANKMFYTHSHLLEDGSIITHAHPYDKGADDTPLKSHRHNSFELTLFKVFSFLPMVCFAFTLALLPKKQHLFDAFFGEKHHFVCWRKIAGRAPPALA